ncbi:acryloyl-CoA reductase [Paenibacillus sp. FJAT-26967]|uniref:acrylyl-CoA reductase family protein n=1 Tax=Paenibacillus sp. FJAT-26967 TaxID=1729690 RepID=UPI000837BCE2|nr:acryloyl-CoA reductase [Paenibacillus sp. FJAT-26967]
MQDSSFRALHAELNAAGGISLGIREMTVGELPAGELLVRVAYSGVNFKDGLASQPESHVVAAYPMILGIDLSGTVVSSADPRFSEGDQILVTGYGLGTGHFGGYSELARVPADWAVPVPGGLSLKDVMALGTAGFTAALSVQRLEDNGLRPDQGPVLVTGATGGVGGSAVSMLAGLGYDVTASTGKSSEHAYLRALGAKDVLPRETLSAEGKALRREQYAAAVDPVGGASLPYVLSTIRYGGSVALSGLAGGGSFPATVYPFILRGVNLLGIDSVNCPAPLRRKIWERLAGDLKPRGLADMIQREITLEEVPAALEDILAGRMRGRAVVRL